jgi:hypothetical protein
MGRASRQSPQVLQVVVGAALGVVLLGTVLEAVMDYFNLSLDATAVAQTFVQRPESLGVVALVGVEEAGVPLPISGDLLIMYSASRAGVNCRALPGAPRSWWGRASFSQSPGAGGPACCAERPARPCS